MSRILFVDDEPNTLEAYRRALRRRFDIETALGATEALEAVRHRGPYTVIVADVRMPEMTGIELFTEIRKTNPEIVRIILTGNADQQTAIDAFERGQVFCYLGKPCPVKALTEALEAGINQYSLTQYSLTTTISPPQS
jgi:DNA-binding NtrC family response regulator